LDDLRAQYTKGIACDFFVVVTATFRVLYVFVVLEVGTRRIVHHNVTAHPTADWTLQQFREALSGDHPYRYGIHDRDRIYSKELNQEVESLGVRALHTGTKALKDLVAWYSAEPRPPFSRAISNTGEFRNLPAWRRLPSISGCRDPQACRRSGRKRFARPQHGPGNRLP
jgi:hypothetical protein